MYPPENCESASGHFWELMTRALTTMVNLKHLYLDPYHDNISFTNNWISLSAPLNGFTFQLETFIWKSIFNPDDGLLEFLMTQNHLRHLECCPEQNDLLCEMLDAGTCKSLVSGAGCFNSFKKFGQSRKITAWKWYKRDPVEIIPDAATVVGDLKYLSVDEFSGIPFRGEIGPIDLNIILLEFGEESWGPYVSRNSHIHNSHIHVPLYAVRPSGPSQICQSFVLLFCRPKIMRAAQVTLRQR